MNLRVRFALWNYRRLIKAIIHNDRLVYHLNERTKEYKKDKDYWFNIWSKAEKKDKEEEMNEILKTN